MTLHEIYDALNAYINEDDISRKSIERKNKRLKAEKELYQRVHFIEQLIEDGLNLEDEFVIKFIWDGGKDDTNK